jgi:hypothetical protein
MLGVSSMMLQTTGSAVLYFYLTVLRHTLLESKLYFFTWPKTSNLTPHTFSTLEKEDLACVR